MTNCKKVPRKYKFECLKDTYGKSYIINARHGFDSGEALMGLAQATKKIGNKKSEVYADKKNKKLYIFYK